MRRDQHPVSPDARRGPPCSCCRNGRVRVHVLTPVNYPIWACPACDRVEIPAERERDNVPLASAPKVPRTTP